MYREKRPGMDAYKTANSSMPASERKPGTLNELYSNPALHAERVVERKGKCKHFSFVVEWQMHNAPPKQESAS